jgi:anti-sigma factor RsiW
LQPFGTPFRSDQIGLSELGRNDAARLRDLPSTAMALSIGAEGTRKSPENGWLRSRIKKIALATANEPKASARSWLEDADLVQAAQAARAELEAETEASHWSK